MSIFLGGLLGKLKKIIYLKDENNPYIKKYIQSLSVEISGSQITFPELKQIGRYTTILNIVNYLSVSSFTFEECKREVFKAQDELRKIIGGNYG